MGKSLDLDMNSNRCNNATGFELMQAKFGAAPADVLMVVRGFANEEHRMEETIKAIKHIAEWRDKGKWIK